MSTIIKINDSGSDQRRRAKIRQGQEGISLLILVFHQKKIFALWFTKIKEKKNVTMIQSD